MLGVVGRKLGMTRIYDAVGEVIPVTVIEAYVGVVVQKKTKDKDGYDALQLGYCDLKANKVNKPLKGHFGKQNLQAKKILKEFRVDNIADFEIGQEVLMKDLFGIGAYVDVSGVTKGKGFAGTIKLHKFHRGPESHGSCHHRAPGSVGSTGPMRVLKGLRLPGRKGNENFTTMNLQIVKVDYNNQLIYVKGAVPGFQLAQVLVQPAVKKKSKMAKAKK